LETGRHHDGKNHLGWINTPWQHSKKKKKAYGIYLKSRHGRDYLDYVKLRNVAIASLRSERLSEITKGILLEGPKKIQKAFHSLPFILPFTYL